MYKNRSGAAAAGVWQQQHLIVTEKLFDYLFVFFFFSIPVAQMMRAGSPSHAMYPDDPHHPIQMSHQPVNER